MCARILLLLSSVFCATRHGDKPISTSTIDLPDDLRTLCPYTKFCDLDPVTQLNYSSRDDHVTYAPCCNPCSCASDCGLRRDCCRDSFDEFQLDHTLQPSCRALNTKKIHNRNEDVYYVIDKCPNQLILNKHKENSSDTKTGRIACGSKQAFIPVYSKSDGRIYHNKHCAICHNIPEQQLINLIPSLKCTDVQTSYTDVLMAVVRASEYEQGCFLQFLVPRGIDISPEKCHRHIIRECKNQSPDGARLARLCQSFNASFDNSNNRYGNVYCYLCASTKTPSIDMLMRYKSVCKEHSNDRFLKNAAFVAFLRGHVYNDIETVADNQETHSDVEKVCFEYANNTTSCRVVFCPEGHFRFGPSCTIFGQTWYVENLQIYIKLSPVETSPKLTIVDIDQIKNNRILSNNKTLIRRHGFQTWDIKLFYNKERNASLVSYFMALVILRKSTLNSKNLLRSINISLKETWEIDFNGKTYKLKPEFNRFTNYYGRKSQDQILIYPFMENFDLKSFSTDSFNFDETLALGNVTEPFDKGYLINRFVITKLFFCRQIELDRDEYRRELDGVYLYDQKKYLWSGEYVVSRYIGGDVAVIRVCLEDVLPSGVKFETFPSLARPCFEVLYTLVTIMSLALKLLI